MKTVANQLRSYLTPSALGSVGVNTHSIKVYPWFPAPDAALPYVVLVKGGAVTDPEFHHLREVFFVDALCMGRARKDEPLVNGLADIVQSAFLNWTDATSGLMFCQGVQRGDLAYTTDLQDQELIELRLAIELAAWPVFQTALT